MSVAVLFVIAVCVALLVANAWLISRAHEAELEQITRANSNLAMAVSQHIEGSIALAEHIVAGIVFELERSDITPSVLERMQPVLVDHVSRTQNIEGIFVFDERGRWVVHSEALAHEQSNNSDRSYFAHHRDNPSEQTLINGPILSRSSGEWIIPVSRRLNDPEGKFAGVVLATLSVKQLRAVLDHFQIGEQGAIAVFQVDQLMIRRPFREADMGRRNLSSALQSLFQAVGSGSTKVVSTIDGVARIISFERLSDYPLVVTVGVGEDEALQDWRAASIYQSTGTVLLCVLVSTSGSYLIRSMRRRLKSERRLRSTRDELFHANNRLSQLAQDDGLTGLSNRRHFDSQLLFAFQTAQEEQLPLAIVMIDVDDFKKYNDLYGHLQGDECLRRIATALRSSVGRPGDLVARYGGEEMVLLLPRTDAAGAVVIADRARLAVLDLHIPHAAVALGSVSISLGVAGWVPSRLGASVELMSAADAALYRAKQKGRNVVEAQA